MSVVVEPDATARRIREYIREHPSIRKDRYADADLEDALLGSCYVAAEAYFHSQGGTDSGLDIYCLSWSDVGYDTDATHWFLRDGETIIDLSLPTAAHGDGVPWEAATRRAFITGYEPSARCQRLLDDIES